MTDSGSAVGRRTPDVRGLLYDLARELPTSDAPVARHGQLQELHRRVIAALGLPEPDGDFVTSGYWLTTARPDRREGAQPDPETEALRAEVVRLTRELEVARSLTERATRALTQMRVAMEPREELGMTRYMSHGAAMDWVDRILADDLPGGDPQ